MNEKTLPPPAGTKAQTAKATSASKPPMPKKRKRRGFLGWFFWLFVLATLVGVFRYPQQVHRLTGWQPPALPAPLLSLLKKGGVLPAESDKAAKQPAVSVASESAVSVASEPAAGGQMDVLRAQIQELSQRLRATEMVADKAASRAGRTEQQLGQIAAQITGLTGRADGGNLADLHVRLIDLQLQFSGDGKKAAADLRRVAATAATTGAATAHLLDEAARLDTVVDRQQLLDALRAMRSPTTTTEAAPTTPNEPTAVGYLKSLFKLRRVHRTDTSLSDDIFMQLEWLLLSGDYEDYWRLLHDSLEDKRLGESVKANLNELIKMGMPAYYLRLS